MEILQLETMNLYDLKIASLGYGNMQKGIMNQLFTKNIVDKNKYTAIVRSEKSREILAKSGMSATLNHAEIRNADVIFLAYKQDGFWAEKVFENMTGKTVISIIAGIKPEDIAKKFVGADIVQAMPNRGSVVGEGCTFLNFSRDFADDKKEMVREFFAESGDVYEVADIAELNKSIIASASMFGVIAFLRDQIHNVLKISRESEKSREFFQYFQKVVENIAKKHNFLPEFATEISAKTFQGVEKLAQEFNYLDIQKSVTSKNGTTQAMIEYLKSQNIENLLTEIFAGNSLDKEKMQNFARILERSCAAGLIRARELAEK